MKRHIVGKTETALFCLAKYIIHILLRYIYNTHTHTTKKKGRHQSCLGLFKFIFNKTRKKCLSFDIDIISAIFVKGEKKSQYKI